MRYATEKDVYGIPKCPANKKKGVRFPVLLNWARKLCIESSFPCPFAICVLHADLSDVSGLGRGGFFLCESDLRNQLQMSI